VTVWRVTNGLEITEAGIKLSIDIRCNEQRSGKPREGIMRMRACCDKILKKKSLSRLASVLDTF
jgi:hypothetical protein